MNKNYQGILNTAMRQVVLLLLVVVGVSGLQAQSDLAKVTNGLKWGYTFNKDTRGSGDNLSNDLGSETTSSFNVKKDRNTISNGVLTCSNSNYPYTTEDLGISGDWTFSIDAVNVSLGNWRDVLTLMYSSTEGYQVQKNGGNILYLFAGTESNNEDRGNLGSVVTDGTVENKTLTFTYSATNKTLKGYVNGLPVMTTTEIESFPLYRVQLCSFPGQKRVCNNGAQFDNLGIWNRVLTDAEIAMLAGRFDIAKDASLITKWYNIRLTPWKDNSDGHVTRYLSVNGADLSIVESQSSATLWGFVGTEDGIKVIAKDTDGKGLTNENPCTLGTPGTFVLKKNTTDNTAFSLSDNATTNKPYLNTAWNGGSPQLERWNDADEGSRIYVLNPTIPYSSNSTFGSVTFAANVATATAEEGYAFDYWSDGQTTYTENPHTFGDGDSKAWVAYFKKTRDTSKPLPPTMGWSSWNTYHALISENNIASQADAIVATGLASKGYNFVNIDDGYQNGRDEDGNLKTDPIRFPNGLQPVVDHIHAYGLKAGTYTDAGSNTCASMYASETGGSGAGIYNYEQKDCNLFFNKNKFDFIKVDYCGAGNLDLNVQKRYTTIGNAIKQYTTREVQLNACRWAFPGTWVGNVANSWRTTGDIWSKWSTDYGASFSVKSIIAENLYLSAYCSPGHYNDMDMLEIGVKRSGEDVLTDQECKTHFGMWCIMTSPLLIGADINNLEQKYIDILGNEELIAVNQDALGLQAYVAKRDGEKYTLVKDIITANGLTRAVALYNPTDEAADMTLTFADINLGGECTVRNLTEKSDEGKFTTSMTKTIPAHGAVIYKVTATERLTRTIYEAETAFCTAYNECDDTEGFSCTINQDSKCSGGVCIGWLGGTKTDAYDIEYSNDLLWKNVYVPDDCRATMRLSFISGEDRNVKLMVNGVDITTLLCNGGGWNKVATIDYTISLKAGNNVVRLYNDDDDMPDIDKMELSGFIKTKTITIGTTGMATTCIPFNAQIPEGVYAYKASIDAGSNVLLTKINSEIGEVLPSGEGVVLNAATGTYTFIESDNTPISVESNSLIGTLSSVILPEGAYILTTSKDDATKAVFKRATGTLKAGRAYLVNTNDARQYINVVWSDSDATGIEEHDVNTTANPAAIYNIAGQRVKQMDKGIYIVNGNKVIK